MAVLHAKGQMKVGDRFVGVSLIDTEFDCRIDDVVDCPASALMGPNRLN